MSKVIIWAGVFFFAEMLLGWLIDWWLVGGIVLAAKMFIDAFRMDRNVEPNKKQYSNDTRQND